MRKGVSPFAYVRVPKGAGTTRVLALAIDGDTLYGVDDDGAFVRTSKRDAKPAP
jgi:hypothetical protein